MSYRTISRDELTKILADHGTWRSSGGTSGARANLARAYLADWINGRCAAQVAANRRDRMEAARARITYFRGKGW